MTSKYFITLLTTAITACSIYPALGQETTASAITFACEDNKGTPITVARNQKGQTLSIFHWQGEDFQGTYDKAMLLELCGRSAKRFHEYAEEGNDLSSVTLRSIYINGLPIICIIDQQEDCNQALFHLPMNPINHNIYYNSLELIINPEIVAHKIDPCKNRDCPPLPTYTVNLIKNKSPT
ncbi:MAG: COP23 domain-containing protein [Cyanobacteria bacterium P01_A01_bin.40]